jgi:hypothetical protein
MLPTLKSVALSALVLAAVAGPALAQQNPLNNPTLKDPGQAVQDNAGQVVECTPERAAQDAALNQKTGLSSGCTPEKAAQGMAKDQMQQNNPMK